MRQVLIFLVAGILFVGLRKLWLYIDGADEPAEAARVEHEPPKRRP